MTIVNDTSSVKNYSKFETTVFTLAKSREFASNFSSCKKYLCDDRRTKSSKTDSQFKNEKKNQLT